MYRRYRLSRMWLHDRRFDLLRAWWWLNREIRYCRYRLRNTAWELH